MSTTEPQKEKKSIGPPDTATLLKSSSTFKPATFGERFRNAENASAKVEALDDSLWSVDLNEGEPVLTVKALVAGVLVGTLCNFLALYYGLKTGVVPSLNILSGLGGFVLVKGFLKVGLFRSKFTPQENAVIQTVAVALYAMSSVGIGFSSSYLAMNWNSWDQLGGNELPGNREEDTVDMSWPRNLAWCLALGLFGFFIAFPLRNEIILRQKLPFPSGTVTAYVIKNMHRVGANTTAAFALLSKFFSIGFCVSLLTWAFEGLDAFPIFGTRMMNNFGWSIDWDIGSFGIGAILPLQIDASMLFGAILTYGVIQPLILVYRNGPAESDWLDMDNLPGGSPTLGLQAYSIFGGLAVMIVCGIWTIIALVHMLVADHMKKRRGGAQDADGSMAADAIVEARALRRGQTETLDEMFRSSRVPSWIPYGGYAVFSVIAIITLHFLFNVRWYMTLVAICIIPIFAISNIQGMGRTDWDVASSYGKILMFPFGVWSRGESIIPSLALCATTISGCSNAASLLQDFKTGQLVGASPSSMFIAQFFGAVVGAFVSPTLFLLLSSTFTLPNSDPTAFVQGRYGLIYRALAVVAAGEGFSALPKNTLWICLGFALFAVLLLTLQATLPEKYQPYIVDPSSMSIGILIPPVVSLQFFIGGFLVWWWSKWDSQARSKVPYVASGCLAGSGIGVVCRCLLSLFGIEPPVTLEWAETTQAMNAGHWVAAIIFIAIFFVVLACGLWYWNQGDESAEGSTHAVSDKNDVSTDYPEEELKEKVA